MRSWTLETISWTCFVGEFGGGGTWAGFCSGSPGRSLALRQQSSRHKSEANAESQPDKLLLTGFERLSERQPQNLRLLAHQPTILWASLASEGHWLTAGGRKEDDKLRIQWESSPPLAGCSFCA